MTKSELQFLLRQTGLKPQRAAGQNFLLDEHVVEAMVDAADVQAEDTVLEIGPGFGILTKQLLATGAKVIAVELDQRLATWLKKHFSAAKNLQLVTGDIFRVRLPEYVQDGGYKLVANLPYSATGLLMRNFLTLPPRPSSLTVMLQRDVAKRLVAEPGEMSLLGLMAQYYSQPTHLFDVPKTSFFPVPAVTSAVVHGELVKNPDAEEAKKIFRLAKAAFSSRRKQVHNSLATMLGLSEDEVEKKLKKLGYDPRRRPQELSVDDWRTLAKNLL